MTKAQRSTGPAGGFTQARRADKYDLYQQSVQAPEAEVKFLSRAYQSAFGRPARVLREDFCGTFAVCCQWVQSRRDRTALGVDLDPQPLDWGRKHNLAKLAPQDQQRVQLLQGDVRDIAGPKADVVAAQNFSYFIFKTRAALRGYFQAAHANLAEQGILALDIMGGYECLEEDREDVRQQDGFKYVWEQARFDPITHDALFHIHFRFKDRSELRKAFTYDWRLWFVPEVRELLLEAGFDRTEVYWEGTDQKTNEGNGVFTRREHAPSDPAFVAYIVGFKGAE